MSGGLNMNNNQLYNLQSIPTDISHTTSKYYTDTYFLKRDGKSSMSGHLNMGSNKITYLAEPTAGSNAATKSMLMTIFLIRTSPFFKKDCNAVMTGDLNTGGHKIINLRTPTTNSEAATKYYTDNLIHHSQIQPSHFKDQFAYLMSSSNQWTDEIDGGNSYNITKIDDLSPSAGNVHDHNHKVLYTTIIKNSQGGYKYKMGINFYRLTANADYTLCLELLNTDYQLWHKSQISVDRGTSQGLTIGNESIKKYTHRYLDSKGQTQYMYYHRIIVNFRKTTSVPYFLHILVNIPQTGTDLAVYPRKFLGVYMIAYGIMGTASNIDPDKVYDYHTAFDIKPTEVSYNVDINANSKKILNINLDRNNNNSAATVGMVQELSPFATNALYRKYFSEFYDFSDVSLYKVTIGSSGVSFTGLNPNIQFTTKNIDQIREDGLNVDGYGLTITVPHSPNYTMCVVMHFWRIRNFHLFSNVAKTNLKTELKYDKTTTKLSLITNLGSRNITVPSSFNGKRIVIWLAENSNANTTKT